MFFMRIKFYKIKYGKQIQLKELSFYRMADDMGELILS